MLHAIGNELIPILSIILAFGVPATIIILVARMRHQQKLELIRRGMNPNILELNYPGKRALFWGILLTALGIAGCVGAVVLEAPPLGNTSLLVLAAGIAVLIYWKLTAREREREKKLYEKFFTPTSGMKQTQAE
ncbi:MAG: hypothetical protein Q8O92_04190 [Candidatus Latescibacter sp.]|nr:hypothetical protein [Candidatus Latescibacter sp.]